jgi:hypothetical protein
MIPTPEQVIEELLLAWHIIGPRAQRKIASIEVTLPDGQIIILK